jgi:hypothetical protein
MRKFRVDSQGVYKGYDWMVVCNPLGFRCGYVRIPEEHPWYGKEYDDLQDVDCHGGLTFGETVDKEEDSYLPVGHWIGFDCGHSFDANDYACYDPEMDIEECHCFTTGGVVRTNEYVEAECKKIIDQARKPE